MDEVNLIGRGRRLKGYRLAYKQNEKGEHVVAIIRGTQGRDAHRMKWASLAAATSGRARVH